jgi:TatD DNase family protein
MVTSRMTASTAAPRMRTIASGLDLMTVAFESHLQQCAQSRVPMDMQRATLEAMLTAMQETPRLTSIHSFAATDTVLECLTARPIRGAVLHWWLGNREQTKQAIDLDCYFSVNASMLRQRDLLAGLPLDRIVPGTVPMWVAGLESVEVQPQ